MTFIGPNTIIHNRITFAVLLAVVVVVTITATGTITTIQSADALVLSTRAEQLLSSLDLAAATDLVIDSKNNLYVINSTGTGANTGTVIKITPFGVVTRVIDGGDGTNSLNAANKLAVDSKDNVYVSGRSSHNVFQIPADGGSVVRIIGFVGGIMTDNPTALAVDSNDNVYVGSTNSKTIYQIPFTNGVAQTPVLIMDRNTIITGTTSKLAAPTALAVDSKDNLYIVSPDNDHVYKIPFTNGVAGTPSLVIGPTGNVPSSTTTILDQPVALAIDSQDNIYVAGNRTNNVFKISSDNPPVTTEIITSRGAGSGTIDRFGVCINMTDCLSEPSALAVDSQDNLYVTGVNSDNVFMITPRGSITEIIDTDAGDGFGGNSLNEPVAIAFDFDIDSNDNVDTGDDIYILGGSSRNLLRLEVSSPPPPDDDQTPPFSVLSSSFEVIITGSGTGVLGETITGANGVALDPQGNVYVAGGGSSDHNAFKITPDGTITRIIDTTANGQGSLTFINDIIVDSQGNVYVAGGGTHNVFKIATDGTTTEVIDSDGSDGVGGNALTLPNHLEVDSADNVYVTASSSNNVFRISPDVPPVITQIIDSTGDGTIGKPLTVPNGIAVDAENNVYVSGRTSNNAFKITPFGTITEIINAGGAGPGMTLNRADGIISDSQGNVYVSGALSNNVLKIEFALDGTRTITEVLNSAGAGPGPASTRDGNSLAQPNRLAVDLQDNLYVAANESHNVFVVSADGETIVEILDIESYNADGTLSGNPGGEPNDIRVGSDGFVYVAGRFSSTVYKITLFGESDLITTPVSVGTISPTDGIVDTLNRATELTTVVIDDRTYALVTGQETVGDLSAMRTDNGIQIIDITDPAVPFGVASINEAKDGYTELYLPDDIDTVIINERTYAVVTSGSDGSMTIIDITDPYLPSRASQITEIRANEASNLEITGVDRAAIPAIFADRTLYAPQADSTGTPFTHLIGINGFDIATIKDKTYVVSAAAGNSVTKYVEGAVPGDPTTPSFNGTLILDITNPANPLVVATVSDEEMDTANPPKAFETLQGANDVSVITFTPTGGTEPKTYALVTASDEAAVQIIDITDPAKPLSVTSIYDDNCATALGVIASGRTCTPILENNAILFNPQSIDTFVHLNNGVEMAYAVIASFDDDGIQILQISDPAIPLAPITTTTGEFGQRGQLEGAIDVEVFVYSTNNGDPLIHFVVSGNSGNGVEIFRFTPPNALTDVVGLSNPIVDMNLSSSNVPTQTSPFTALREPHGITGVSIDGKPYVLAASTAEDAVTIINITSANTPVPAVIIHDDTGGYPALTNPTDMTLVTIDERIYAMVSSPVAGAVQVIDVTNPLSPFAVSNMTDTTGDQNDQTVFSGLDGASEISTFTLNVNSNTHTFALIAATMDNAVTIVNMTDPYNPTPVYRIMNGIPDSTGTTQYAMRNIVSVFALQFDTNTGTKTYAITSAGIFSNVQIIDISATLMDPTSNPTIIQTLQGANTNTPGERGLLSVNFGTSITINDTLYGLFNSRTGNAMQLLDFTPLTTDTPTDVVFPAVDLVAFDKSANEPDSTFTALQGASFTLPLPIGDDIFAVVAGNDDSAIQIINITTPSALSPTSVIFDDSQDPDDFINGFEGSDALQDVEDFASFTVGDFTYLLATGFTDDAIQMIDISDPTMPKPLMSLQNDVDGFTKLAGVHHVEIITVGDNHYALATGSRTNDPGIEIIHLNPPIEGDGGTIFVPRSGGGNGCSGECTHPTIGLDPNNRRLVTNGFTYNGQSVNAVHFHTPFPLINATVGETNTVTIKAWEDQGPENIALVQFGLGLPEISSPLSNAEVVIEAWLESTNTLDVTDLVITDPHNLIENDSVSVATSVVPCATDSEEACMQLSLQHVYREAPIHNVLQVDVMDTSRNLQSTTFNDGVGVVGESMNPADILHIASDIPKHHPFRDGGVMELTNINRAQNLWIDPYGYIWNGGPSKMTLISDIPFKRFVDDASVFSGYNDRMNSNFQDYKMQQILKAQEAFDYITSYKKIQNGDLTDYIPETMLVAIPTDRANDVQLQSAISSERLKATEMLKSMLPSVVDDDEN